MPRMLTGGVALTAVIDADISSSVFSHSPYSLLFPPLAASLEELLLSRTSTVPCGGTPSAVNSPVACEVLLTAHKSVTVRRDEAVHDRSGISENWTVIDCVSLLGLNNAAAAALPARGRTQI